MSADTDVRDLVRHAAASPLEPIDPAGIRERATRRRRRRIGLTAAAALVALVVGAVLVGSLPGLDNSADPVAPRIDTPFGPAMAEVHLCPAQIPDCPDLPSDDAVNMVVDLLDSHPDAEVTDVPSDPAATPTGNDDATTAPSSLTVAFRLDRTTSADQLLRDLVSLPVVSSVSIGSAEQPPSAFAELDDVPTGPRRELGHLEVPVHGDNEPVVFEIWEAQGRICHGAESLFSHCGNLTVTEGTVAGGTSSGNDPNCVTAITGIGVDHVRMGFADGTLLQVATTQLHPALTLLDLHAACWQDGPANVITEIIAPDGTVIDRNPSGVPLPSLNR